MMKAASSPEEHKVFNLCVKTTIYKSFLLAGSSYLSYFPWSSVTVLSGVLPAFQEFVIVFPNSNYQN